MSKAIAKNNVSVVFLAATAVLSFLTVVAQEPKGTEKKRGDKPPSIVGAWDAQDRHLAMGTLYQPFHGTRIRESTVYFKQDGDKLSGYSVTPKGEGLSGSNAWKDGRTEFRTVTFADGKLVFEFDVKEVEHDWDLAVKDKATIRVEAKLTEGRLVGKWGLFLTDGAEPFRGEWEAVPAKAKEPEKK
jgi:hypothetical protein